MILLIGVSFIMIRQFTLSLLFLDKIDKLFKGKYFYTLLIVKLFQLVSLGRGKPRSLSRLN